MSVQKTDTHRVEIVPGRLEHCFVLAQNMRPEDARELEACGQTPLEGVLHAFSKSLSGAALYDDALGAMFGVTDEGVLWSLTTPLFEEKSIAFVRAARQVVSGLLQSFERVGNFIDGRYTGALRLAQALGAEFGSPKLVGGVPFVPFVFRRT